MEMQINSRELEKWAKAVQLEPATDTLLPIIQAAKLLHAHKIKEDAGFLCKMCGQLTGNQIMKILDIYTPVGQYDESPRFSFKRKIKSTLKKQGKMNDEISMDENFTFTVSFPVNPPNIRLEDIEIPDILNLTMVKKI